MHDTEWKLGHTELIMAGKAKSGNYGGRLRSQRLSARGSSQASCCRRDAGRDRQVIRRRHINDLAPLMRPCHPHGGHPSMLTKIKRGIQLKPIAR